MANAKGSTPETSEESTATEETEEGQSSEETVETEESTESESEGEGQEKPEQYFKLADVPASLLPIAKQMQATHTKKMQALALDTRKAAALDDLMENGDFQRFLADVEAGKPYGASAERMTAREKVKSEEEGEEAGVSTGGKIDMDKLIQTLMPSIQEVVGKAIAPLVNERANETWSKTRSKFSDFDDYLPDITKLIKAYPNMSPERAYKLAKAESDEVEPRKPTKEEAAKAKGARTLGAGAAKGSTGEVKPATVKTLRDALKHGFAAQGIRVE